MEKNLKKRKHQEYWTHAPYQMKSKIQRLTPSSSTKCNSSSFSLLPGSSNISKICVKEPRPLLSSGPTKCFPPPTTACDNITDITALQDHQLKSKLLAEDSQEQHAIPGLHKTPVLTNDIGTSTEEIIFNKLDQTLLIDHSTYFHLLIDNNVSNLKIEPGVSFLAYCNNMDYHDTTIPIIIPKGYYLGSRGQFHLNEEICELNCTICKQEIIDCSPQGIGFRNCTVQVKYRDTDRKTNCFSFDVNGDTFAFTKFSQPGHVRYFYVRFEVNTL